MPNRTSDQQSAAATSANQHIRSSGRLVGSSGDNVLRLESQLTRVHAVTFADGVLAADNDLIRDCVGGRGALAVLSPAAERFYGRRIRAYFRGAHGVEFMVLRCREATKTLDGALAVAAAAAAAGISRRAPIVAFGGGVCTDLSGVAAALYRRGTPHINVPTTLVGQIDAGIGTKNAVNHDGRKSALGSFHPPEHTVIDPGFLATLPPRQFRNGLAEIIKLATVCDQTLFRLLEEHVAGLLESSFQVPAGAAGQVIRRSVTGMLGELAANPFEHAVFQRKVDFGHTFSPGLEVASGHSILHGEAVAMDVALSSQIAHSLGYLTEHDLDRILSLLEASGLELTWAGVRPEALWATLPVTVAHRNGNLNLVVPTGIADCAYLEVGQLSRKLIGVCLDRLRQRVPVRSGRSRDLDLMPVAGDPGPP